MDRFLPNLLVFGRLLRAAGLEVHMGRMLDLVGALQLVDLGSRDDVYHTCRCLLVHRREELPRFDRAFEAFWREWASGVPARERAEHDRTDGATEGGTGEGADAARATPAIDADGHATPDAAALRTWSDAARIADKDFAACTPEEMQQARLALAALSWNTGERRTRRWVGGRGPRLDVRRALGRSLRTGGDVVHLPRRRRRTRPRRLVLLCDVSGSMERYSRLLLHFAHAMRMRHRRVEAFLFSTALTRVTAELRHRRVDDAVAAVAHAVPDWSGGTRIGDSLRQFHQRWRRRVLHGGPVVLLVSDGWDGGAPEVLREEIARLQRSCDRLVWLNPLIGTPDYAPLTRGLRAALPFVDDFLPARTLNNLRDLAVHLNALQNRRAIGASTPRPIHAGTRLERRT